MAKDRIFRTVLIVSLALALGLGIPGCVVKKKERPVSAAKNISVEQAFDSHRDSLLSIPGVVGAGIAKLDQKPCIMVMVQASTPEIERLVPKELDGYPVVIEITGDFKALERK